MPWTIEGKSQVRIKFSFNWFYLITTSGKTLNARTMSNKELFSPKLFVISILCLLLGCNNKQNTQACPHSSFISPFPKRSINLCNRLGDSFSVEAFTYTESVIYTNNDNLEIKPDTIQDTINYQIIYNKTNKHNLIIESEYKDTVFNGLISKYRGMFFCSQKINDTSFWIGGMKIKDGFIQGLGNIKEQMCILDSFANNPQLNNILILKDTLNKVFRLAPEKKILKDIYSDILKGMPRYKLIDHYDIKVAKKEEGIKDLNNNKDPQIVRESLIESYFPNPATDHVQIDLAKIDNYVIQIADNNGKILLSAIIPIYS